MGTVVEATSEGYRVTLFTDTGWVVYDVTDGVELVEEVDVD